MANNTRHPVPIEPVERLCEGDEPLGPSPAGSSSARRHRQLTFVIPASLASRSATRTMSASASMPVARSNDGASIIVTDPGPHPTSRYSPRPSSPSASLRTSAIAAG
jgi:hypothetical protein